MAHVMSNWQSNGGSRLPELGAKGWQDVLAGARESGDDTSRAGSTVEPR